jgi:histidine triad (HIT) family protein
MPFQLAPYDACGFCRYVAGQLEWVLLAEDDLAAAFVNHRQYERGAALVIPRAHRETILDLSAAEIASLYGLARRLAHAMEAAFGACGVNVYQNNGIKAGQHVPHVHVHVVPRYPTSDPERLFLQRDFPIVPLADLRVIAAALYEPLRATG